MPELELPAEIRGNYSEFSNSLVARASPVASQKFGALAGSRRFSKNIAEADAGYNAVSLQEAMLNDDPIQCHHN